MPARVMRERGGGGGGRSRSLRGTEKEGGEGGVQAQREVLRRRGAQVVEREVLRTRYTTVDPGDTLQWNPGAHLCLLPLVLTSAW